MGTKKILFVVFVSVFLITGNSKILNAGEHDSSGDCTELLADKKSYTPYEQDIARSIVGITQKAIKQEVLTLDAFALALVNENYDISKILFIEKVFALTNLPVESRTHIGKLVLLNSLDIQFQSRRSEIDHLWAQLSAARVLNAMIRDRVILSSEFTDLILELTARELNVGEVYPGGGHLHLNKQLVEWVRERRWDKKTDDLKRIGFFVTQVLKEKTHNFSDYYHLLEVQKADMDVFDAFVNDLVQPMIIDTLELASEVRRDRLFSVRDSVRVAGTNVVTTGLMVAGAQVVLMGDIPSLTAMATGGAICGAYLLWGDIYAHLKGWLAQRRLVMYWKESTQQQCQAFDSAIDVYFKQTNRLITGMVLVDFPPACLLTACTRNMFTSRSMRT
jgi:hypothetical protein